MKVGIISEETHAKTVSALLSESGHQVVLLGGRPSYIPPTLDVLVCRVAGSSHHGSDIALQWKRSGKPVIFANGNNAIIDEVNKLAGNVPTIPSAALSMAAKGAVQAGVIDEKPPEAQQPLPLPPEKLTLKASLNGLMDTLGFFCPLLHRLTLEQATEVLQNEVLPSAKNTAAWQPLLEQMRKANDASIRIKAAELFGNSRQKVDGIVYHSYFENTPTGSVAQVICMRPGHPTDLPDKVAQAFGLTKDPSRAVKGISFPNHPLNEKQRAFEAAKRAVASVLPEMPEAKETPPPPVAPPPVVVAAPPVVEPVAPKQEMPMSMKDELKALEAMCREVMHKHNVKEWHITPAGTKYQRIVIEEGDLS